MMRWKETKNIPTLVVWRVSRFGICTARYRDYDRRALCSNVCVRNSHWTKLGWQLQLVWYLQRSDDVALILVSHTLLLLKSSTVSSRWQSPKHRWNGRSHHCIKYAHYWFSICASICALVLFISEREKDTEIAAFVSSAWLRLIFRVPCVHCLLSLSLSLTLRCFFLSHTQLGQRAHVQRTARTRNSSLLQSNNKLLMSRMWACMSSIVQSPLFTATIGSIIWFLVFRRSLCQTPERHDRTALWNTTQYRRIVWT